MAPKPSIVPRLVIIEGKDKGKVIPLSDGTAVIGRTKGDVLVQDPRVSRSHIAIHYDSKTQKLTFTDLKSLNGTVLNGAPSELGELKDGDKIQLGNTLFDCQIGDAVDEETSVSKVRHQLQKEKVERQQRENSLSNSGRVEPDLAIVAAEGDVEQSISVGEPPEEISSSGEPLPTLRVRKRKRDTELAEEPRPRAMMSGLRLGAKKFPSRLRNIGLGVILILGLLYYANLGRIPATGTQGSFETAAIPVRKLLSQGRSEDALKKALELVEKFPNHADAHMLVGNLLALQQKNEPAIAEYLKAKELNPEDPLIHTNLVRLYIKSGQMELADAEMKVIDKMVTEGKHTKALFVEVAQLLLEFRKELKQPPEKALILAKALQTQLAPESSIGYKLEAHAHDQEGRKPEALAAFEKGLLVEPNDTWLLENSAILRLELRDFVGATTTVEKWIERHPASSKPLLIMGYLKFQGGDPAGAVRYLQQILQASNNNLRIPEAREAVYLLAQVAWSQKSFKEAIELYKQACQAGFEPACTQEIQLKKSLETTPDGGAPSAPGAESANAAPPPERPPAADNAPPPLPGQ